MRFDYSKLKGKIVECFGTYKDFAKILNITSSALSMKLTKGYSFSSEQMKVVVDALNINHSDVYEYFFSIKNAKMREE